MMGRTDHRFQTADVLATDVTAGEVRCNIGYSETGKGIGASEAMWFGVDGFIGRPNPPNSEGACMALWFADGNDRRVIAYRDNRYAARVGEIQDGDRAIVSSGEARFLLKVESDTVSLVSASQPDNGQTMQVSVSGESGEITLQVGGGFIKISNSEITMGVGGGKTIVTIDEDGFQVDGNQTRLATLSGHLGVLAPLTPPPPVNGIAYGPTGPVNTFSVGWTVAP